jgi:hypothetical protein
MLERTSDALTTSPSSAARGPPRREDVARMEIYEVFGAGDIDGSGQVVTPKEGLAWILQCQEALGERKSARGASVMVEYSQQLVEEQRAWLDKLPKPSPSN